MPLFSKLLPIFCIANWVTIGVSQNLPLKPVSDQGSIKYSIGIGVGSPLQEQDIIIDTTTADLWLTSKVCSSKKCGNYPRFDPSDSTSFKSQNESFSVSGRSGTWSTDTIQLGNLTLGQVEMGLVTSEETPQPPLFGLGRPSVGQSPHKDGPVNRLSTSTSRVGITLDPVQPQSARGSWP